MPIHELSSKIWNFFIINAINEYKANCDVCNEKLIKGGSNAHSYGTSALISHLRSFHRVEYDEYIRESEETERLFLHINNATRFVPRSGK